MLTNLFCSKERVPWIEDALVQHIERVWSLQPGTLIDGRISFISSDTAGLSFTPAGGVVRCPDQDLAERLIAEIELDRWEDGVDCLADLVEIVKAKMPDAPTNPFVMLYKQPSSKISTRDDIVPVSAEEANPNRNPNAPKPEVVLAIRNGSTIISHSTVFEPMCVINNRAFYELGVTTHPDYRRKGLARDVVNAALAYVASKNGVAIVNIRTANKASLGLARAFGFVDFCWTLDWTVYSS